MPFQQSFVARRIRNLIRIKSVAFIKDGHFCHFFSVLIFYIKFYIHLLGKISFITMNNRIRHRVADCQSKISQLFFRPTQLSKACFNGTSCFLRAPLRAFK